MEREIERVVSDQMGESWGTDLLIQYLVQGEHEVGVVEVNGVI